MDQKEGKIFKLYQILLEEKDSVYNNLQDLTKKIQEISVFLDDNATEVEIEKSDKKLSKKSKTIAKNQEKSKSPPVTSESPKKSIKTVDALEDKESGKLQSGTVKEGNWFDADAKLKWTEDLEYRERLLYVKRNKKGDFSFKNYVRDIIGEENAKETVLVRQEDSFWWVLFPSKADKDKVISEFTANKIKAISIDDVLTRDEMFSRKKALEFVNKIRKAEDPVIIDRDKVIFKNKKYVFNTEESELIAIPM